MSHYCKHPESSEDSVLQCNDCLALAQEALKLAVRAYKERLNNPTSVILPLGIISELVLLGRRAVKEKAI